MPSSFNKNKEYIKIAVPAIAAVVLFAFAMFGVFLPSYQNSLMNGKKEMIREMVVVSWGILDSFEQKERSGEMTRQQAQEQAIRQVRTLRYGPEGKDYFWINDMQPVMIMHPYRVDLEGQDVAAFVDPEGTRLFSDFVDVVRRDNEGYVRYMWQWKDDSKKIVPKLSFVRGFSPWGWIIGSGIYLEDVREEIEGLTRRLLFGTLAILVVVAAVASLLVRQALQAARLRQEAEARLLAHQKDLENQVRDRTRGLREANEKLSAEINERTLAEQTVSRQNLFLHSILESLPYPFYVVDPGDYTIIHANSVAEQLVKTAGGGKCFSLHGRETPCDGTDHDCPMDLVKGTGRPAVVEHIHSDSQGRDRYFEVHAFPVCDESGRVIQVIEYSIDITDRKLAETEREKLISELRDALEQIKTLRGIVPICSFCKQIRDDKGYWNQVDQYVSEHSHAQFSHSICPKCLVEKYPDLADEDDE